MSRDVVEITRLLYDFQMDLQFAWLRPEPSTKGEPHRICSQWGGGVPCEALETTCPYAEKLEAESGGVRVQYHPVVACVLDGRKEVSRDQPRGLPALLDAIGAQPPLLHVQRFSEELRGYTPRGLVPFSSVVAGLPQPQGYSEVQKLIEDPQKGGRSGYGLLAQCLARGTRPAIVVRDGEIAFFSLLYLLSTKRFKTRPRLFWKTLRELGLCSTRKKPKPRLWRMLIWLHFQKVMATTLEEARTRANLPVKDPAQVDWYYAFFKSLPNELDQLIEYVTKYFIGSDNFFAQGLLAGTPRDEWIRQYTNLYKAIEKRQPEGCPDPFSILKDIVGVVPADHFNAEQVKRASRTVDLGIEMTWRGNDSSDFNVVVVQVGTLGDGTSVDEWALAQAAERAHVLGFVNVNGPLPPEGPELLLHLTGPVLGMVSSLASLATTVQLSEIYRQRNLDNPPILDWTPSQWLAIRDAVPERTLSATGDGSRNRPESRNCWDPHHWPGTGDFSEGSMTIREKALSSLRATEALKTVPGLGSLIGSSASGEWLSGRPFNVPLWALCQNYRRQRNDGSNDGPLTQLLRLWGRRCRERYRCSVAWWIPDPLDYLWFNAPAILAGLEYFLSKLDLEKYRANVRVFTRDRWVFFEEVTNPPLEFNQSFPKGGGVGVVKPETAQALQRFWNGGAAFVLYCGRSASSLGSGLETRQWAFLEPNAGEGGDGFRCLKLQNVKNVQATSAFVGLPLNLTATLSVGVCASEKNNLPQSDTGCLRPQFCGPARSGGA